MYDENQLMDEVTDTIKTSAQRIRDTSEYLVCIGIGGSYLGALASINALRGLFPIDKLEIIFLGNTFSPTYIQSNLSRILVASLILWSINFFNNFNRIFYSI